jgi:steroid 5-alpha reductase family enzyme
VTGSYLHLLFLGAALASAGMVVLGVIQARIGDAGHVDVGWAIGIAFRVTGIPATEAQALRSRPDYAVYRRTTSVFVPLPPRELR